MTVEIKIIIEPKFGFNESDLINDIKWQFSEITGYEPKEIEINIDTPLD